MHKLARISVAILFVVLALHTGVAEAATRPSAPRAVKATPGNHAVRITWSAPVSTGGAAIDKYAVQRWFPAQHKWLSVKNTGAGARAFTNVGLVNGTKYYFRVLAHNRVGWSAASAQAAATPRTVPSAPRALEADAYESALGIYWLPPTSNGGAPIGYYRVEVSTDGATWTAPRNVAAAATKAAPVIYADLTVGGRYWLRVRAHNVAGFSAPVGAGPFRVYTAPGPVSDLVATPGDGQVALSWTPPVFDPSTPWFGGVGRYRVERSTDGTIWSEVTDPAARPTGSQFTATGLTNGQQYHFRVSAQSVVSRIGFGPGVEVLADAPLGSPSVPQNLTLGWDEVAGEFKLDWDAPATDGGQPLTKYQAEYWTATTPPPFPVAEFSPSTTQALVDTFPLDHTMHVRACSAHGCGPWTADIGPVPGQVTAATVDDNRAGSSYTVTVDWDPPTNSGVAAPTGYRVLRSTNGGLTYVPLATLGASTTTYDDTTAVGETSYRYRIVADGTDGSGQPRDLDITTGPVYLLGASPVTLSVVEGSSTTFTVSIDPVASSDTVITVASNDTGAAVTATPTVTIPAGQTSAVVTVNGVDDVDLANDAVVITASLGGQQKLISVTVIDNDMQAVIAADSTVTINDGDSTAVGVSLAFMPSGNVTVLVGSSDPTAATVAPTSLVFTPANYQVPQDITVTGQSPGTATINLTATGASSGTIAVTVAASP